MLKTLTWTSAILLFALLTYWPIAAKTGPNLRDMRGQDHFPTASFLLRNYEFAWLVNCDGALIWMTHDHAGGNLPLIGRYGFINTWFSRITGWQAPGERHRFGQIIEMTITGNGPAGTPVTARWLYIKFTWLIVPFAILPAIATFRLSRRRLTRSIAFHRARRLRRWRNSLGHCGGCGYDLRSAQTRCPECGRRIRLIPISLPPRRKQTDHA